MRALSMKKGNCEWNGFESFQDDYEKKFGEPPKVSSPTVFIRRNKKTCYIKWTFDFPLGSQEFSHLVDHEQFQYFLTELFQSSRKPRGCSLFPGPLFGYWRYCPIEIGDTVFNYVSRQGAKWLQEWMEE